MESISLNFSLLCSLRRDIRFKQAQKLQSWMVIPTFKTCKVWFFLNLSMCSSGFSRILRNSVTNFPWVFSSLQNFINSSFSLEFPASPQPFSPFYSNILESQVNHWFPCFVLRLTGHVSCPSLSRFHSLFFHLFLPLVSISLKVYGWLPFSGHAEVTPFSIPLFGSSSSLPFFPAGRNPILPVWKSSVAIPFFILLHSGSPRRFPLAPWEVADSFFFSCWVVWRLWLLSLFLVFLFVLFFRTVLIFRWLYLYA